MTTAPTQPTFWDPPAPKRRERRGSADTSQRALDRARDTGHLQQVEREVLAVLRERGPLTRHQIADAIPRPLSSVCGRVTALMRVGLIREAVTDQGDPLIEHGRHVLETTPTLNQQRAG